MPALSIPLAHSIAINDRTLAQLRRVAHDAPKELASEAEAEWLLTCCGPLLDELARRRAVMDAMATPDQTNVIVLAAVR